MEYAPKKAYSAVNADELQPGGNVCLAANVLALKRKETEGSAEGTAILTKILPLAWLPRFLDSEGLSWYFAYLVSRRAKETYVPWAHATRPLHCGDVLRATKTDAQVLVTGVQGCICAEPAVMLGMGYEPYSKLLCNYRQMNGEPCGHRICEEQETV